MCQCFTQLDYKVSFLPQNLLLLSLLKNLIIQSQAGTKVISFHEYMTSYRMVGGITFFCFPANRYLDTPSSSQCQAYLPWSILPCMFVKWGTFTYRKRIPRPIRLNHSVLVSNSLLNGLSNCSADHNRIYFFLGSFIHRGLDCSIMSIRRL